MTLLRSLVLLAALWVPVARADAASIVRLSVIDARGDAAPLARGTQAPRIERAQRLDGTTASLDLVRGVPTVVNIWATWCPPCVKEIPDLVQASVRYAGRVNFIGLADDSPHDDVVKLAARLAIPYELFEIDGSTARAFNVSALPSTYIVDARGVVQWSFTGAIDGAMLDAQLGPVLGVGAALLPGEIVLGAGFAVRAGGVIVTTHDVMRRAGDDLIAVGADGKQLPIVGVFVDDGALALLQVDADLPVLALDGALTSGSSTIPAADVSALLAATPLDAPTPLGPDVERNLVISAVFFAVLAALAFLAPPIVRWVRRRPKKKRPLVH